MIRTVSALLWHETSAKRIEVLLHRHKKARMFMGFGGKVDDNESEHEALEREFFEESGIVLTLEIGMIDYWRQRYLPPNDVVKVYLDNGNEYYLDHVYYLKVGSKIRQNKIEVEDGVTEYGWYDINWAIDNLPMFEDTKSQLARIQSQFLVDSQETLC